MPISLAVTGWVTEWSNAALPFVLGGGLMVAGAVFAFARPAVRGIRLRAAEHRQPEPANS